MSNTSVTYPAPTPQVEAVERELARLRRARPELTSRIDRAENILVTQLSVAAHRPLSVRVHADGTRSFTVRSCAKFGKAYTVTSDFRCNCPDTKRRSGVKTPVRPPACKHGIAAFVIDRVLLTGSRSTPTPSKTSSKSSPCSACAGCGERVPNVELTEVADYHESLSYFAGDMLCVDCFSGSDCW